MNDNEIVFTVGDIAVSKTPHNHGWTVTRDEGRQVLIGTVWEDSSYRHVTDVMRYFADLEEAKNAATAAAEALFDGVDFNIGLRLRMSKANITEWAALYGVEPTGKAVLADLWGCDARLLLDGRMAEVIGVDVSEAVKSVLPQKPPAFRHDRPYEATRSAVEAYFGRGDVGPFVEMAKAYGFQDADRMVCDYIRARAAGWNQESVNRYQEMIDAAWDEV